MQLGRAGGQNRAPVMRGTALPVGDDATRGVDHGDWDFVFTSECDGDGHGKQHQCVPTGL